MPTPEKLNPNVLKAAAELADPSKRWITTSYGHATACANYITKEMDALSMEDWPGSRIWLNPPYGSKIAPFVRDAAREAEKGKTVVALVPLRTRAAWFHDYVIGRAREVRCVRKRIVFLRPDGTIPNYTGSCDSMIIVWPGAYSGETRIVGWEQP